MKLPSSSSIFVPLIAALAATPGPGWAMLSFQATGSAGVYRDLYGDLHEPVQLTWTLHHATPSSVETNIDLGMNNQIETARYRPYLYQAYVDVPLGRDRWDRSRRSRVQLGRQLLTEGFMLSILDGAQLPYYLAPGTAVSLYGGSTSAPESPELAFQSWIYGGSVKTRVFDFTPKAGLMQAKRKDSYGTFGYASLGRTFEEVPLQPAFLVKGQWGLNPVAIDQYLGEIQLTPHSDWLFTVDYGDRRPSAFDAANAPFIYKIFSLSSQKSAGTGLTWLTTREFRIETRYQQAQYVSPAGRERADQEELSATYHPGAPSQPQTWTPSVLRVRSYGGHAIQSGLRTTRRFGRFWEGRVEAYAVFVDKVNRISGWAYQTRAGGSFRLGSRFLFLLLGQLERNHFFTFDAGAVGYVSYFYY